MRHYKVIDNGYVTMLGTGYGGVEITAEEYSAIKEVIKSMPPAPDGYGYRLKADLTWELYELPVAEEDLTAEEALSIILGGDTV